MREMDSVGTGHRNSIDDIIEIYKRDVDRTLLRENLRRTPEQRVQAMQNALELIMEMRRAYRDRR